MPYGEAKKAYIKKVEGNYYEEKLKEAEKGPKQRVQEKNVIKPEEMPWENSRQGLIKYLVNEKINARVETVDIYMQFLPPGSHSGKHRHMAEELMFILEGQGYSLHWDVDVEIKDKYYWKVSETPSKWEWEQSDFVYIPPNTVHQHFNADPNNPARFLCAESRIMKQMGFNDLEQIENSPDHNPEGK